MFAHIRAASTGVIVDVNNHPFVFGRHAIMHNGYISDYHSVAVQMAGLMAPEVYASIKGRTDSEALAALYMTYLTAGEKHSSAQQKGMEKGGGGEESWEKMYSTQEMFDALQNTVNTIIELQKVALGSKCSSNDLNVCVTDGRQLVACRFRNHKTEQPPSLYWSTSAGVTLNRKYPDHADGAEAPHGKATKPVEGTHGEKVEGHNPFMVKKAKDHGKHVIVASEPTTYKKVEWDLIEKNHAILVEADGNQSVRAITFDSNVQAVDWEA